MATITAPTSTPTSRTTAPGTVERRIAGIGALTFATTVLITNGLLRSTPAADAEAAEVITYLADNRTTNILSAVGFALAAPFLLGFACAFYGRLKARLQDRDLVWARMGFIGAVLILPTFAAVVTNRLVLIVGGDEIIGTPELVSLVWRTEMAAFMLNTLPLGVAVLGFGIAGARAGLLPAWYRRVAPVGAACAVLSAATAVGNLEGSPFGLAGLVAFASWMLLLVLAGVRSLRAAA